MLYGQVRKYQEANIIKSTCFCNNPTSYIFPVSIDSLKNIIFTIQNFKGFQYNKYLYQTDTANNIYILHTVTSNLKSYIYRYNNKNIQKKKAVAQDFKYKVSLERLSENKTIVSVSTIDHSICCGIKYWMNLKYSTGYPKIMSVESTTIEEYEFLRYIGKLLGYIDTMPYVQYPQDLSQKDILRIFYYENPFSLKEMFNGETDTTIIGNNEYFKYHDLK